MIEVGFVIILLGWGWYELFYLCLVAEKMWEREIKLDLCVVNLTMKVIHSLFSWCLDHFPFVFLLFSFSMGLGYLVLFLFLMRSDCIGYWIL